MAQGVILRKFYECTKNLNQRESRKKIFEYIRNIPYAVIPEFSEPDKGPMRMLTLNRGSCVPKHFTLGTMYQRLGVPIRYTTYPFKWGLLSVDSPQMLKKLALEMPMDYHVACKAYVNNKWILVDATWDPPLKKLGFPVNENWDGISDTLNAIRPLEEIFHESPRDRTKYVDTKTASQSEKEKSVSRRFYNELNKWLEEVREVA